MLGLELELLLPWFESLKLSSSHSEGRRVRRVFSRIHRVWWSVYWFEPTMTWRNEFLLVQNIQNIKHSSHAIVLSRWYKIVNNWDNCKYLFVIVWAEKLVRYIGRPKTPLHFRCFYYPQSSLGCSLKTFLSLLTWFQSSYYTLCTENNHIIHYIHVHM